LKDTLGIIDNSSITFIAKSLVMHSGGFRQDSDSRRPKSTVRKKCESLKHWNVDSI